MSGFLGLTGGSGVLGVTGALGQFNALAGGLTLQLGDVIFSEADLEVPTEIGNLAGDQLIAEHRYPGGTIVHQTYGAFPSEITWRGHLTGPSALDRINQLDAMRIAAQPVSLFYGPKVWTGRIASIEIRPRHQWFIDYTIRYLPLKDITSPNPSGQPTTPESQLSGQLSSLSSLGNGDPFDMPGDLQTPVANLLVATQQGLASANGIVDNILLPDALLVGAAVNVTLATGAIVMTTGTTADAYMAAASMNAATIVGQITTTHGKPVRTVSVVNPNLVALAAQYMNDPTQWAQIAFVNNISPIDPFPLGKFTLLIPAPNTTPILTP